jgi:predicted lipoprotein with Yx(FWY)xxD motif
MQSTARSRPSRRPLVFVLLALAAALLLVPALGLARTAPTKRVVKLEESMSGSLLANLKGRTLYSLSVEKHGKFICTGGCLSIWHPLLVPKGVRPTGPVALGTIERPEGTTQVTYRGRPLYSFDEDTKAGETNGEGIKDVGTWHAATAKGATSRDPEPTPPTTTEPYPTNPYPTAPAQTEPPPQTPPKEPPYQYPPYNY